MSLSKENLARLKKPGFWLLLALALCIAGSFLANMFNTSFYQVKVERIEFETERGTLSALLYVPRGASSEDPRAGIVTTHGYLNSKEMQDAPAIEMSRRGFVVMALDMYDHGDSSWENDIPQGREFGTFWVYSLFDAVDHMYEYDFIRKDAEGNASIAVSGHSMGGFSSIAAVVFDEQRYQTNLTNGDPAYRKIAAALPTGADFSYLAIAGITQDAAMAAFNERSIGFIAGHYDEFFFNKSTAEKVGSELKVEGTVVYKDFAATASGKRFVGLDPDGAAATPGEVYTVDGGKRVIYTPNEIHPWNHFSKETTGNQIDFYTSVAFANDTSENQSLLVSGNQIWWFKEFFSLIGLIGFFMLIIPAVMLLLKVPFFAYAKKEKNAPMPEPATKGQKVIYWIIVSFTALFPAYYFPTLMNKKADGIGELSTIAGNIIEVIYFVLVGLWLVYLIFTLFKSKDEAKEVKERTLRYTISGIFILVASYALKYLLDYAADLFNTTSYYSQPTTNQIIYWALVVAAVGVLVTVAFHFFAKKGQGVSVKQYGIYANYKRVLVNLVLAVSVVVGAYLVLFITQMIFNTDFRFWTFAVRTFKWSHFVNALKYMPLFFIFFLVNSVVINANTNGEKLRGWRGYLVGILMNVGGLVLYLILHYGRLFTTGVANNPDQALNSILLFALIPVLIVSTIYTKWLYRKTNSVYLGAFINAILITMITVANTVVYTSLV